MAEYIAEDLYDECGSLIGVQDNGELIRCMDCKRWDCGENEIDQWSYCKRHKHNCNPTDFCSWAERKEE